MEQPIDLCLHIIELRSYAQAKTAVENAQGSDGEDNLPDHPMIDLVWQVLAEQAKERAAAREQRIKGKTGA